MTHRHRRLAAMALLCLLGLLAAACTSARNTLGTNASPCFSALPVASQAVHGRGSFAGVLLVSSAAVSTSRSDRVKEVRSELEARAGHPLRSVCAVAYTGRFTPSQVDRFLGPAPSSGSSRYAVVVLEHPGNRVLATLLRDRAPLHFEHSRVGA